MKIIIICLITYWIYDYVRERKIEKELADIKEECLKGGDHNAR